MFQMTANIHSKPLRTLVLTYSYTPKALKRSAPTNGDHQKLCFVLVGAYGDVISCHSDAQHKAIIHATETSFIFNLSTQFIWAVY